MPRTFRDLTRAACVAILSAVTAAACTHRAPAAEAQYFTLRGAVVAMRDQQINVRHKSGQVMPLVLDSSTVYLKGAQASTREAIAVGSRVAVEVVREGGIDRAMRIQVFGGTRARAPQ